MVRAMAGIAFAILRRRVLDLGNLELLRGFLVARGTQSSLFFHQQPFKWGCVRLVAGSALSLSRGLVFGFRTFRNRLMAIRAQPGAGLYQHFGYIAPVRIVARRTLSPISRLMLEFCFFEEIIVAAETDLFLAALYFDREPGFMALGALLFLEGRMGVELDQRE